MWDVSAVVLAAAVRAANDTGTGRTRDTRRLDRVTRAKMFVLIWAEGFFIFSP
jgi:hypothetical protein